MEKTQLFLFVDWRRVAARRWAGYLLFLCSTQLLTKEERKHVVESKQSKALRKSGKKEKRKWMNLSDSDKSVAGVARTRRCCIVFHLFSARCLSIKLFAVLWNWSGKCFHPAWKWKWEIFSYKQKSKKLEEETRECLHNQTSMHYPFQREKLELSGELKYFSVPLSKNYFMRKNFRHFKTFS